MARPVYLALLTALSLAGGSIVAHAYDNRVDPNAARRTEFSVTLPTEAKLALALGSLDKLTRDKPDLPLEYASAMTWYRAAFANGHQQPPIVASPWGYDEQLPETLHWTWVADDGDILTRSGKGVFRLSFADNHSNWFRETECQLQSWPDGTAEAPLSCGDGVARTMQIPGDGIVLIDGVQFTRVFTSEETTLPPEEVVSIDEATAAAIADEPIARDDGVKLPELGPIPTFR
jgi:hypothetical protein